MGKKRPMHYAERAKRIFLRGTAFDSPHAAIEAGARTEEEWHAILEGQKHRMYFETGLIGRQRTRRHPMKRGQNDTK